MKTTMKWTAVCLVLALPGELQAADLPFSAFFGTFSGGGVAENEDSAYFALTARDMDVVIRPDGAGFKVTWTSVIRPGGNSSKPRIKRKTTTRAFAPTDRAGIFRADSSADPISGKEMCWAHIEGQSLIVYQMVIGGDGAYQLQRYARTLSGLGMQLTFTRIRDGERIRTVRGRLVKSVN
jgi:hypothetical protein